MDDLTPIYVHSSLNKVLPSYVCLVLVCTTQQHTNTSFSQPTVTTQANPLLKATANNNTVRRVDNNQQYCKKAPQENENNQQYCE
jgi:hypothetical protein